MTDIEWAMVHYDGNNNEPYADLVVHALGQKRETDALAAEYGIDAKTMLVLARNQIKTAKENVKLIEENMQLRESTDNNCDSCACNLLDRAEKAETELEKAKEFSDDKIKLCDKLYEQLSIEISCLEQYESKLTKLKESGFCATCIGCNAPHDPDKITWCMDWEYKRK